MTRFTVGQKVKIRETGDEGTIEASNVAHKPTRYLVSYTKSNGANYQDWFGEDQVIEAEAADGAGAQAAGSTGDEAKTAGEGDAGGGGEGAAGQAAGDAGDAGGDEGTLEDPRD